MRIDVNNNNKEDSLDNRRLLTNNVNTDSAIPLIYDPNNVNTDFVSTAYGDDIVYDESMFFQYSPTTSLPTDTNIHSSSTLNNSSNYNLFQNIAKIKMRLAESLPEIKENDRLRFDIPKDLNKKYNTVANLRSNRSEERYKNCYSSSTQRKKRLPPITSPKKSEVKGCYLYTTNGQYLLDPLNIHSNIIDEIENFPPFKKPSFILKKEAPKFYLVRV